jgi:hypothetical protein
MISSLAVSNPQRQRHLSTHSIQSALEILFQSRSSLPEGLLWSWVLGSPSTAGLGNGDGRALGGGLLAWLDADVLSEPLDLVQDHLAHLADVLDDLEVEVEGGRAAGLVRGVVPDVQIWVLEGGLDGDSRRGVECQHLVQQVQRIWVGVGEEGLEGSLGHEREVAHVLLSSGRANPGQGLLVGGTEDMKDLVELVDVISALEEWASTEKLCEDASNRPHIDYNLLAGK